MTDRLIVVANRLPLTLRRSGGRWHAERSSGGLVAALAPVAERSAALWIGWPGDAPPDDPGGRDALLRQWERDHALAAVDIPAGVGRGFYDGFANDTLWPVLHGFPSRVTFDPETFVAYRDVNRRFADAILERASADDLVWVHDYQLALVPRLVRDARPGARVGFFLHVPFPAPEVFRILPQREEILLGLLGADVVGFQTYEHLGAFRRCLAQVLGVESRMDRVDLGDRTVWLDARPIGIVAADWDRLVDADPAVTRRVAEIRSRYAGRRLIVAVDRLDYTKGIPERLRAYRHFLTTWPEWRGRVALVQVAVPSREAIPRYAALRREVNELVGEIGGAFGTPDWNPVVYVRRPVARPDLAALYSAADVGWVSSLRDGMNLVAKEFIACQREDPGVLLLSEFAGAAGEMGEAIRVNPFDIPGSAAALERALVMPAPERAERQAVLHARVRRNDAVAWAEGFVEHLSHATRGNGADGPRIAEPPVRAMADAFRRADRRACYLDLDGTLVPLAPRPADARPGADALAVVAALARCPATTVVIISGRPRSDLDEWFGGHDGLWLAAEHGALVRGPGPDGWHPMRPGVGPEWKVRVRAVLDHFLARVPGSALEEKEETLAWHYRLVEPEFGDWVANDLAATLDEQLAGTELTVLRGNKVVEVRYAWANKGEAVAHVRSLGGSAGFELAIGDDRTDEEMFARIDGGGWTVHVGPGPTAARFRVRDPAATIALLAVLADAGRVGARATAAPAALKA